MALLWNLQDVDDTLWLAKQNPSRGRTGVWRGTIVICCLRTDGWCGSKHIHSVGGGGGGGGGSSGGGGCNIVHTGMFISFQFYMRCLFPIKRQNSDLRKCPEFPRASRQSC
jgi:hypothetical protein